MSVLRILLILAAIVGFGAGCGGKKKEITSLQRKEAATLESEAQFALTLKDFPRAEGLLARAAELTPDSGELWVRLGMTRMRMGERGGAKKAYASALEAFKDAAEAARKGEEAKKNPAEASKREAGLMLHQVNVLVLLGRPDDARKLAEKIGTRFPENRAVRAFVDGKSLDRMLADPAFKELAL